MPSGRRPQAHCSGLTIELFPTRAVSQCSRPRAPQDTHMTLESALRRAGGVSATGPLLRAGHTFRSLAAGVESGLMQRPRRGWIALREADPLLVMAARHNTVVSCVSAARLLGLWTLNTAEVHLATRSPRARAPQCDAIVHWARPPVPRHPDSLIDEVANVIDLVARCQPHESALVIIESTLNQRLATREALMRLPLSTAAQALVAQATPFADSGLESLVRGRLSWLPEPILAQAWVEGHRVDLLIGARLIIQIDGAHHTGAQRDADIRHDALLMTLGYSVMRVSYRQVMEHWHEVQSRVLDAVAQGLHRR